VSYGSEAHFPLAFPRKGLGVSRNALRKARRVGRLEAPNSLWRPFRLTNFGKQGNQLMWEVEVVLGYEDRLERVEMLYKPPPPF
jgi:hypothetical protein